MPWTSSLGNTFTIGTNRLLGPPTNTANSNLWMNLPSCFFIEWRIITMTMPWRFRPNERMEDIRDMRKYTGGKVEELEASNYNKG